MGTTGTNLDLRLTIGYVEDLVVTAVVRDLRRRRPEAAVDTLHLDCTGLGALPEGRVDVGERGAGGRDRTDDLLFTRQLLYH